MFVADLPPVVDVILKVSVLLGLAALTTRALARGSAAARHQVWVVAIAASLMMPVLAFVGPQWTLAVLPAPTAVAALAPVEHATPVLEAVSTAAPIAAASADPVFEPIPAVSPSMGEEPQAPRAAANGFSTITSIWLAGVLLVLARLAFGTARVWWMARRATPAAGWARLGDDLAWLLGIDRRVTFLSGDEDAMPMAWGLFRARVLLPTEADDWPIERQRVVLLHELAHVKRRDCATQMLAHVACAAYWFNPLVWLAAKRLRAERERACDDLVLAAGTRGSDYADHLLDIARSLRSGAWPTWSAVTMAHRSQLEGRLMAILDPAVPRRSPTRRSVVVCAAVAVISIVSLAGVRLVAKAVEAAEQGRPSALVAPTPTPTPAPMPIPAPIAMPTVAPPAPQAVQPRPAPVPRPAPIMQVPAPPVPPLAQGRVAVPRPAPLPPVAPFPELPDIDIDVDRISLGVESMLRAQAQAVNRAATTADPKVVAALTAALKDEDQEVRQQALHTLIRMRAPLPPDVFANMLKDKSPEIRQQAISAIGQTRDVKYLGVIIEALKDPNAEVRQQAAFALGRLRDPKAVDPLMTALKDADPEVRQQAAYGLGQIRDARAIDALIAALKDSNAEVRQQAVFALGQIR
jgi:beta-lactamase regulating signal transducer with metallopeptidase domain